MPCNTLQRAKVNLGKTDKNLLTLAFAETARQHGIYAERVVEHNVVKTLMRYPRTMTSEQATMLVKQEYSRQVVLSQAKRYGWQVTETKRNVFQVVKR